MITFRHSVSDLHITSVKNLSRERARQSETLVWVDFLLPFQPIILQILSLFGKNLLMILGIILMDYLGFGTYINFFHLQDHTFTQKTKCTICTEKAQQYILLIGFKWLGDPIMVNPIVFLICSTFINIILNLERKSQIYFPRQVFVSGYCHLYVFLKINAIKILEDYITTENDEKQRQDVLQNFTLYDF